MIWLRFTEREGLLVSYPLQQAPCTVPGLGLEFGKLLANVLLNK